ncbi:sporulation protein YpjB [Metabacillus herbersteinensis]|uniref:Sporulation protein YpjB n=1 Tax=Metabacillus herbersteinensis TaxID=283816 RepID=A0ABV6GD63_9BACI
MPLVVAEETYDWKSLNNISDTALQLAKQERFSEAAQLLNYFATEFEQIPLDREALSLDHLRTITSTHQRALEVLGNDGLSTDEKVRTLTQFRLVVDAMVSEHQPLWGSLETSIMATFSQLKSNLASGNQQSFNNEWNRFLTLYDMIYPSIQVDSDSTHVKRIDAHISVVEDSFFEQVSETTKVKQLTLMEEELRDLFDRVKEDDADPSLLWVMISTGSVIFLSLSYAGWRLYRGEKEKEIQRDREK